MGKVSIDEKVANTIESIKECIALSCNVKEFDVTLVKKINPKDGSMGTINAIFKKKGDNRTTRQLTVSLDVDKRTGLSHIVILNVDKLNTNILFNTTGDNPIAKIEKYLPNIVSSTQAILSKTSKVTLVRK